MCFFCSYLAAHKNQYARDDPAFVVLLAAFLCGKWQLVFLAEFSTCVLFWGEEGKK
jgi:hypothetical protein